MNGISTSPSPSNLHIVPHASSHGVKQEEAIIRLLQMRPESLSHLLTGPRVYIEEPLWVWIFLSAVRQLLIDQSCGFSQFSSNQTACSGIDAQCCDRELTRVCKPSHPPSIELMNKCLHLALCRHMKHVNVEGLPQYDWSGRDNQYLSEASLTTEKKEPSWLQLANGATVSSISVRLSGSSVDQRHFRQSFHLIYDLTNTVVSEKVQETGS